MKPGYKQTEVGVIPEDWEVKSLGELANLNQPQTISAKEFTDYGYPVYGANGVVGYYHRTNHQTSQVTVTCRGSTCGTVNRTVDECWITGNAMVLNCDHNKELSKDFFYYLLLAQDMSDCITGTGQPQIVRSALAAFRVGLPKQPLEQHAIAEALSDVDGLLGGLDRLIAKKRDLKQAAMQQLLTTQTRLPGFHGEWVTKSFGELFDFTGGYSASRDELSATGHCYLHYGDIHTNNRTTVDVSADYADIPKLDVPLKRVSPGSLLEDGDVVFVDASEDDEGTSKHVVIVNKEGRPFISGLHTIVAKAKTDELVHAYRRFCFQTKAIKEQFKFYAVGTKVSGISKSNIPKLTLPVPPQAEQTAIAEVLGEMDGELAALERRREKTLALKQAMMQQLLTGQTRLVAPAASNVLPVDFTAPAPAPAPVAPAVAAPTEKKHNWAINEAVVVAVLVKHFGSEKFPLGRKRCTKLSYLLHRHVEHVAQGYLKKAAGPYNPAVKYQGPEGIAQKNGYIRSHKNGTFSGYVAADKIDQAERYFAEWYGPDVLSWLDQFRFKSNDDLERLATVDMAMEELRRAGTEISLTSVRTLIASEPEWVPKLDRSTFSDPNITSAIQQCRTLFPA